MSKKYNHTEVEELYTKIWRDNSSLKFSGNDKDVYSIDTPPPTVSGQLHIGHIYSYTHTDFIARYQRMIGKNVFYPIGFDDNGLPTERLVEKKKKIKAKDISRDEFKQLCYQVIEEEENKFEDLFKKTGISFDWDLKYQTINSTSQKISQMSFLELLEQGQIYRSNQPVFWDTTDNTAIAQAEIEEIEKEGEMYYVKLDDELSIGTTRPELLQACVAILYNPDDSRYTHLKGKNIATPLFEKQVPFLSDELVKIDKGTGLVICCTFGDTLDLTWWRKHNLPLHNIFSKTGRIQENPKALNEYHQTEKGKKLFLDEFVGLKIKEARKLTVQMLTDQKKIIKTESIVHGVKCAERSKTPIEIIPDMQWFIKTLDHKEKMLELCEELQWQPQTMKIKLRTWIESLSQDWCISRKRYFGVPIPIWYSKRKGEEGKIIIPSLDQLPVDPTTALPQGYDESEVIAEKEVLDTWATSSVSPQLNSMAITNDYAIDRELHKKIFPFSLRPQSHEIIRTWTFYTMVKSFLHSKCLPWENIMISGWCLAKDKSKMSKSKGNIIDPSVWIKMYGADAVRYWASQSSLGDDTYFCEETIKKGKKLVNKIYNAAKFCIIQLSNINTDEIRSSVTEYYSNKNNDLKSLQKYITNDVDKWMVSNLDKTITSTQSSLQQYQYSTGIKTLENFFMGTFCNNYLEMIKMRIYDEKESNILDRISCTISLLHCMSVISKMFAPYMPFISEYIHSEIYSDYSKKDYSIHSKSTWPKISNTYSYEDRIGDCLSDLLFLVRKYKSQKQYSMTHTIRNIDVLLKNNIELSEDFVNDIKNVLKSEEISFVNRIDDINDVYETNSVKIKIYR